MLVLDALAGREHYADHLQPVVAALRARGADVGTWGLSRGPEWRPGFPPGRGPVLVASASDARRARGRPVVYLEHGAGQTYGPRAFGYPGGSGLDHVVLFLAPGERTAEAWRAAGYRAPVAAVGCPKLDALHEHGRIEARRPCVVVTFHWDCHVVPESRSAWSHYDRVLPDLWEWALDHDVDLIGHAHPRIWARLGPRWRHIGVPSLRRGDSVLAQADLLVADNTSLMYEAASLGTPVLALNAPWYRRGVEHGLRFWSHVPGHQVDDPELLVPGVAAALAQPGASAALRKRAVRAVYAATDGQAAARAADAILGVLSA